ncbi:THAP domain-containing protein 1 [Araneus ventricosus]|uniref:THAP domain-containing protein 1 n=1 Tax=Araneus ventricosus TaxID=182803 RepID=A0A4Y2P4C8_ARAVE|nr:THAP domain-containing protein 1 [Araneus ventricosus]
MLEGQQKESSIMPNFCSAYGCSNRGQKANCKEKGISFHHFPLNDKDRLKQWLVNIRRKNFKPTTYHRLCSEHFTNEDFEYQLFTNRRGLKNTAVPTKFCFTTTETPARPRTPYEFESRIVQNDICETEASSRKEKSTQTNDIFNNHLLTEIERLKTENAQLKTDVKMITEYLIQLFENQ